MKKRHVFLVTVSIILLSIISGCYGTRDTSHRDQLYVTRKYVGNFQASEVMKVGWIFKRKVTKINTTRAEFYLTGEPKLDIPQGTGCYVKYFPEHIPNSIETIPVLYFTWNGTYDMYHVWQNPYTGEVY